MTITFFADAPFHINLSETVPWALQLLPHMDGAAFMTSTIDPWPLETALICTLKSASALVCSLESRLIDPAAGPAPLCPCFPLCPSSEAILSLIAIEHGFHEILQLQGFAPVLKFLGVKARLAAGSQRMSLENCLKSYAAMLVRFFSCFSCVCMCLLDF